MCLAYYEDIEAFVRDLGGVVTVSRLAVTPEQIARYDLPAAPPKPTDRRASVGQTCQAEALPPDVLASILIGAIEARIHGRVYGGVLGGERKVQRDVLNRLRE